MKLYRSWKQAAGYFDGDGSIYFADTSNQPYKLSLGLIFVDKSLGQIQMLKEFLNRNGIITSNILKASAGTAYMIAMGSFEQVLRAMKALLPHLHKKENEIRAAIDYYEGRITGNQLSLVFNQEIEAGRRERHPHKVKIDVPYTYPEGDALMKARRREIIVAAINESRAKVSKKDYNDIRKAHFEMGWSLSKLRKSYPQYSRETIRRFLGRGRGYVLVKDSATSNESR